MTKFIYRFFNAVTLTFILGVLTGLIVNTYTGSAENDDYDKATVFFLIALFLNVGLTVIQGQIRTALDKRINSNNNLEPGQFRASFDIMERDSLKEKPYFRWCLHIFSYVMLACTVTAVICYHNGNQQANQEGLAYNKILSKELVDMRSAEQQLVIKIDALNQKIALTRKESPELAEKKKRHH